MKNETSAPSYKRHRFPPEIIAHAVWLYFRFARSYRDVEELLAERGVIRTDETVRRWCQQFGRTDANEARRRRPRPGDPWHPDAVFVRSNGAQRYRWRAVDQDGAVRAIPVQARRERRRRRSSCTRCSRAAPTCRGWCSRTRAPATARRGAPRCRASSIASTSDRITAPSLPTSPRGSARAGGGAARTRATPSGSSPPPARAPRTAARAATARPPPPTPRRGPRASRRGGRSPAPRRWPDQRRHPPSPRPRSPAILPARLYLTVPCTALGRETRV